MQRLFKYENCVGYMQILCIHFGFQWALEPISWILRDDLNIWCILIQKTPTYNQNGVTGIDFTHPPRTIKQDKIHETAVFSNIGYNSSILWETARPKFSIPNRGNPNGLERFPCVEHSKLKICESQERRDFSGQSTREEKAVQRGFKHLLSLYKSSSNSDH